MLGVRGTLGNCQQALQLVNAKPVVRLPMNHPMTIRTKRYQVLQAVDKLFGC